MARARRLASLTTVTDWSRIAGAYGNVGAIAFLTVFLFASPQVFFLVIAAAAAVGALITRWLVEPANRFSPVQCE